MVIIGIFHLIWIIPLLLVVYTRIKLSNIKKIIEKRKQILSHISWLTKIKTVEERDARNFDRKVHDLLSADAGESIKLVDIFPENVGLKRNVRISNLDASMEYKATIKYEELSVLDISVVELNEMIQDLNNYIKEKNIRKIDIFLISLSNVYGLLGLDEINELEIIEQIQPLYNVRS
ncbi:hypothetical protein MKY30_16165 [Oceanobacillus sp. FSL W8-0428]|uniref:hypothetical protein n=1 Tax=Oceanobacillus sp. FSL W8-0428 TaxID=2921715 RepID=UPI0030FA51E3